MKLVYAANLTSDFFVIQIIYKLLQIPIIYKLYRHHIDL